jgi:hypothetical protein
VTDIFRRHAEAYDRDHALRPAQGKVLRAISACRTAALGGHLGICDQCGYEHPFYDSCRNRHCPGCQASAQYDWLEGRLARVLPTHHFHVVFTLPEELRPLTLRNGAMVYDIMMKAAGKVLSTLAAQRLGAQLGVTTVLHTWTRAMLFHPNVHCVVTGGGLALDGSRWIATPRHYLFPVAVMRKLFRGLVRAELVRAWPVTPRTPRPSSRPRRAPCLRQAPPLHPPQALGRILPAALRCLRGGLRLPRPLHPQGRHLRSPPRLHLRRRHHLHDQGRWARHREPRGVHPPLPAPCPADQFPQDPAPRAVRIGPRQRQARASQGAPPFPHRHGGRAHAASSNLGFTPGQEAIGRSSAQS